eukprot:SAG25_NODE_81_length_16694_cov_8.663332_9_plen_113_part_00
MHTASYMLSLVPGPISQAGPSPRAHYPPPRRRPTTRPTRCHPAQATDGRRPCRGQLKAPLHELKSVKHKFGSVRSGGEGGRDEHSGDESDDEEAGAVDIDYFTTLLQQGERY